MSCYICRIKSYKIVMSRGIHGKKKFLGEKFVPSGVIQEALDNDSGVRDACVGRNVYKEIRYREGLMHDGRGDVDVLMRECKVLERYL